jgi:hypothetical protein
MQHSEIIIKLARFFQQLKKKRVEFSIFFSSKISFTHIPFCSSKIRIFNSGLVSNKKTYYQSPFSTTLCASKYVYTRDLYTAVAERNVTTAHCRASLALYVSVRV